MTTRATLRDVAARAGVSKATASRVLGGSRDRVSDALAAKVVAAASELEYVPNPHAQALARASSPSVAVIVHDVADPYFSEIARGALRVAADHQRLVMICTTFRDPEREIAYVAEMRAQRIHAILVAGSFSVGLEAGGRLRTELDSYLDEGGRVALMTEGYGLASVVPDNHGGGRLAGQHLAELGHRRLGVIAGPAHVVSVRDRVAGFARAVEGAGLDFTVVNGDFTREGGAGAASRLLGDRPDTTAILALNDLMAVGAIRHIESEGRRVPDDVSVVGFDDIPMVADLNPGLTTIRVPMETLGALAMETVLGEAGDGAPIVLDTELVVRGTTAPPPLHSS